MKFYVFWVFILIVLDTAAQQPAKSAAELKKEMGKIMHETNWSDKAQADSANAKIAELSKQMMMIGARQQVPEGEANQGKYEDKLEENVEYQMQLWNQMWKIGKSGDRSKADLAEPLRVEIVEAYKEDEDPTIRNPVWRDSMPDLTINMSLPHIQVIIDQMPVFRGIRRLIITCEQEGTAVDLDQILYNAGNYQLTELYILNFGPSVTSLPLQVGNFKGLTVLNLLNNNLNKLPTSISGLTNLKVLYVDLNPVTQLLPVVSPLKNLEKLGIAKTEISESEIGLIRQTLPGCNILAQ
ncbi:MAG: hypothetical protein AB9834_08305 [Lentimicrobium sp.]